MRVDVGCVVVLLGMMGCVMDTAALDGSDTSLAGKRGLSLMSPDYILKTCQETEHSTTAFSGVDPAYGLKNYLQNRDNHYVDLAVIKIALLEGPMHGELTPGKFAYTYDPEPEYIGKDQAVFMAEFEGKRYKIVVELVVVEQVNETPLTSAQRPVCPPPRLIKVNGKHQ